MDGLVGRAGVYEYPNEDGSIQRELRPEDEVFRADSLAGFEGAPITDGHPSKPVDTSNVKQLEIGTVTGPAVRVDGGDFIGAPMVFKDKAAIGKIDRREKRQLSPGYKIDLDETPGVHPKYGRYDAIQRNIVINHVALVKSARGGEKIQLRMDGLDARQETAAQEGFDAAPRREGKLNMDPEEQIRLLKTQLADAEKLARERKDSLDTATADADKAKAAIDPLKSRIEELEATIAAGATAVETDAISKERVRADEAEAAVRRFDEKFVDGVRKRTALMFKAAVVMGQDFRMDDMSERAIHTAVVKRLDSSADTKPMSDAFLAGKFDTLVELHHKTARSLSRVSTAIVEERGAQRADDAEAKKKAFRDQWKQPLPNDIRANRKGV